MTAPSPADPRPTRSPLRDLLSATLPVLAAGLVGVAATIPNVPTWYAALVKPPLTPPDAVFGPAWTILYAAMAYAVWRVLRRPPTTERREALSWFYLQLALNGLWSPLFFAAHETMLALVEIVLLLAAIAVTVRAVARVDRPAAALLVPYAAWTAFAVYLNAGIVVLNR